MDKWGNGSKSQRESPSGMRFRPRHCTDALLSTTRLRPRPRFPCPILVHLAATCFPKNAHPRPHSRPQRLLGEPSPERVSRISPCKKRPPQTRRALLTQSRNLLRSPAAYSPNAFFSALTRLRLTGIFSSTPFSVSSSVPPETDSISSTMERFTRYPRCTRKNPWPSRRFSS